MPRRLTIVLLLLLISVCCSGIAQAQSQYLESGQSGFALKHVSDSDDNDSKLKYAMQLGLSYKSLVDFEFYVNSGNRMWGSSKPHATEYRFKLTKPLIHSGDNSGFGVEVYGMAETTNYSYLIRQDRYGYFGPFINYHKAYAAGTRVYYRPAIETGFALIPSIGYAYVCSIDEHHRPGDFVYWGYKNYYGELTASIDVVIAGTVVLETIYQSSRDSYHFISRLGIIIKKG